MQIILTGQFTHYLFFMIIRFNSLQQVICENSKKILDVVLQKNRKNLILNYDFNLFIPYIKMQGIGRTETISQ